METRRPCSHHGTKYIAYAFDPLCLVPLDTRSLSHRPFHCSLLLSGYSFLFVRTKPIIAGPMMRDQMFADVQYRIGASGQVARSTSNLDH